MRYFSDAISATSLLCGLGDTLNISEQILSAPRLPHILIDQTEGQDYAKDLPKIRAVFRFWPFNRVKRLQNNGKYEICQNRLDTRQKMETHDPNVYPTILGGVSRGFWSPFLDLGALSAIF